MTTHLKLNGKKKPQSIFIPDKEMF